MTLILVPSIDVIFNKNNVLLLITSKRVYLLSFYKMKGTDVEVISREIIFEISVLI
jgi:hypothetical protein